MSEGVASLRTLLGDLVAAGAVSGAAARVAGPQGPVATAAAGEAPGPGARFDLGSLTKPFTATLALVLDAGGTLPLAAAVGEVFPGAHPGLAGKALGDLLRHRAGLVSWFPFHGVCGGRGEVLDRLLCGELLGGEAGTYSDLDYLLWGFAAEKVSGRSLDDLFRHHLFEPLGLAHVAPSPGRSVGLVPCRLDNGREVELAAALGVALAPVAAPPPGVVQDGNARFLGGLAGHAGLFGTVSDLEALGREWLRPGRLLRREQVAGALTGEGPWALGWARWDPAGSAAPLSPAAFGHLGFPGGSLWVDPEGERIYTLLAHRTASTVDLTPWRRRFHEL